jgi:hypothetical protein
MMIERRVSTRRTVDMTIKRQIDGESCFCRACEISPTGIRMKRIFLPEDEGGLIDIELPLVEGGITTELTCRRVWRKGRYEAYEFIDSSFSQQALLERVFGNY